MGKARLRTKTGCMTCRERRKKCDETKPLCQGCSRNGLTCVWPTTSQFLDKRNYPQKATKRKLPYDSSSRERNKEPDIFSPAAYARVWAASSVRSELEDDPAYSNMDLSLVLSNAFPDTDYASPISSVPQSLAPAMDTVLLPFYTNEFLPGLLHPNADLRYRDFSYTYQLAMDSPTFMNAASACASMTLAVRHGSQSGQEQAMRFYSKAVSEMREGLVSGEIHGSEDWLLGAVIALCLFENRRPDSVPRMASTHIAAIAEIFRVRREKRLAIQRNWSDVSLDPSLTSLSPQDYAVSVFERTSVESFLYHSLVMTLFDRHLDTGMFLRTRDIFDDYFLTCPLPTAYATSNWPILGMPYALFRLIVDVATLAKRLPLVNPADLMLAAQQVEELGLWEQRLGIDVAGSPQFDEFIGEARPTSVAAGLYLFVAKILALRLLHSHTLYDEITVPEITQLYIRRSISLIKSLDLAGVSFSRFYIWPLTILGCATEEDEDVRIVREKLFEIRRSQLGAVGIIDWIRWTIEGIWKKTGRSEDQLGMDGGRKKGGAGLDMLIQEIGD